MSHTSSYNHVMARLNAGGRDLLDGFSAWEFEGISGDERHELVNLFTKYSDFETLSLLMPVDVVREVVCRAIDEKSQTADIYVDAIIKACKINAIDDALERLVACLDGLPDWPLSRGCPEFCVNGI